MKKIINHLAVFAIFGVCVATFAATTQPVASNTVATNAPTRIGVLDMRQVMERSTQIAQIREKLQKEFKSKQDQLLTAQTKLKNDSDRYRRDNAIMSNADRKQLEQNIKTEEENLRTMQANSQRQLMEAQNKELKGFLDNAKSVIEKIAVEQDLSVVITKDTVAYFKPNVDITNKVIEKIPHR